VGKRNEITFVGALNLTPLPLAGKAMSYNHTVKTVKQINSPSTSEILVPPLRLEVGSRELEGRRSKICQFITLLISNIQSPISKWRFNQAVPWLYVLAIGGTELLVGLVNVTAGLISHFTLLFILLVHAVVLSTRGTKDKTGPDTLGYNFYLSLTLVPFIRILSLSMPLASFSLPYWYLIVGTPLFAAAFLVIRLTGYRAQDIYLRIKNLPLQLAFGFVGLPLGIIEFHILQPAPLIKTFNLAQVWLPALILLIFTGLAEELIFRGILQKSAGEYLKRRAALFYVSLLFAVMHITHLVTLDVFFVFGVALFFALLVWKTNSLLGVTLSHGLTNITLYLVCPFFL